MGLLRLLWSFKTRLLLLVTPLGAEKPHKRFPAANFHVAGADSRGRYALRRWNCNNADPDRAQDRTCPQTSSYRRRLKESTQSLARQVCRLVGRNSPYELRPRVALETAPDPSAVKM